MQRSIGYIWSGNFCFWIWIWPQNLKNVPFKYTKYFLGSQIEITSFILKELHYLNIEVRFKFSSKNQFELIPNMPHLSKKSHFQAIQSSRYFLEDFRNDGIFEFHIENQVPWQNLSGKNNLHVEISQNCTNPGDSRISRILNSRVQKSKGCP